MAREDLPSLVGVAQALAEGDLTREAIIKVERVQITSQDEIGAMGEDVSQMIDALQHVGAAFAEVGVQLRDAIGQVQVAATGSRRAPISSAWRRTSPAWPFSTSRRRCRRSRPARRSRPTVPRRRARTSSSSWR